MKSFKITYKGLRMWAFGFLLLPVLIFLLFFVKRIISVPVAALLVAAYCFAVREPTKQAQSFEIPAGRLVIFLLICAVWCFLGGQGGLFYQTSDWNERNAIFRDLITNPWPVYYPVTDTVLTYYIGHWLPAAFLGRLVFLVSGNVDMSFFIGNILLGLWTLLGVMITALLHICSVRPKTGKGQWLVFLMMLGFSGMDILGCIIKNWTVSDMLSILHFEWWAGGYQFSSNTTCLFWVFNQAVTAWIATLCFYNENNNRSYAFIIGCALLSASLPSIGLAVLMIGKVVYDVVVKARSRELAHYAKRTFSFANIVTAGFWVPLIGLYLMSNSAMEKTVEGSGVAQKPLAEHMKLFIVALLVLLAVALAVHLYVRRVRKIKSPFLLCCSGLLAVMILLVYSIHDVGASYFAFLALEVGLHWLLLAEDFHEDPMYYLVALIFVIAPCIKVGIGADFCMRATIPALTVLMILCAKKLCAWVESDRKVKKPLRTQFTCGLLVLMLVIGLATPAMEIYRGIHITLEEGEMVLPADSIYTLNQYHSSGGIYGNFVSDSYRESPFFRYFASES